MASHFIQSFGWMALAGGVITLAIAIASRWRVKRQSQWISVPGIVSTSEVTFDGELYDPTVIYSYTVSGRQFIGRVVRSGLVCFNWRGPAERICKRYAPGTKVQVYVDQNNPSSAVLEPGGDRAFQPLMFVVAVVLSLVGLLALAA